MYRPWRGEPYQPVAGLLDEERVLDELRVLLVSDPNTDRAAASLSVLRGYYHEPREYPGLAHFLEHMLFIGTEKYPEVDG